MVFGVWREREGERERGGNGEAFEGDGVCEVHFCKFISDVRFFHLTITNKRYLKGQKGSFHLPS